MHRGGPGGSSTSGKLKDKVRCFVQETAPLRCEDARYDEDMVEMWAFMSRNSQLFQGSWRRRPEKPSPLMQARKDSAR
jgi:hypothetical protein